MTDTGSGQERVWLITGVSSGFGRSLAEAALGRGDTVIGTLRSPSQFAEFERLRLGRAFPLQLDVTSAEQIARAADEAIAIRGRVDVLVNNAGYGMVGAIEETSIDEARKIFQTNFFGMLQVVQALLPQLRRQGSGHIINMSSGAGIGAVPGMGLYSATKFAVEGLSEALAAEIAGLGIKVTIVEPGAFLTKFASGGIVEAAQKIAAYAPITGMGKAGVQKYYEGRAGDPAKAARALVDLVEMAKPPLRLVLGADALAGVRAKVERLRSDFDACEAVALSTAAGSALR